MKTIRRKLDETALLGKAAPWHRELARRRAEENPAALATLYIDGHVRAYHGLHRIGQTRISRLKRVMRAEEDYWVHQAQGQPLLVVHESVDSSFHEALVNRVLPEIRKVVGDRRVRIVFDREGWSRPLFLDLLRLNFDFITYRKGNYEPLPDSKFETVALTIPGHRHGLDVWAYLREVLPRRGCVQFRARDRAARLGAGWLRMGHDGSGLQRRQ